MTATRVLRERACFGFDMASASDGALAITKRSISSPPSSPGTGNAANGTLLSGPSASNSSRFRSWPSSRRPSNIPPSSRLAAPVVVPSRASRCAARMARSSEAAIGQQCVLQRVVREQPRISAGIADEVRQHGGVLRQRRLRSHERLGQRGLAGGDSMARADLVHLRARLRDGAAHGLLPASSAPGRCRLDSRRSCNDVSRARNAGSSGSMVRNVSLAPTASSSASERARTSSAMRNACQGACASAPASSAAMRASYGAYRADRKRARHSGFADLTRTRPTIAIASSAAAVAPRTSRVPSSARGRAPCSCRCG